MAWMPFVGARAAPSKHAPRAQQYSDPPSLTGVAGPPPADPLVPLHPAREPPAEPPSEPREYRAVWISDVHLGSRGCKAERLLEFLRGMSCQSLYLVGDIVDAWALGEGWYWPRAHGDVIRELMQKSHDGARLTYLRGNHDDFVKRYAGWELAGIEFAECVTHGLRDGRTLLVLHGDTLDPALRNGRRLAELGGRAFEWALWFSRPFGMVQRRLSYPRRSWVALIREIVEDAFTPVLGYEAALLNEARRQGLAGVVCGHNHRPELRDRDGAIYANDGDWVENCTALVEHLDGRLELPRMTA